jgi:uncharacterized protein
MIAAALALAAAAAAGVAVTAPGPQAPLAGTLVEAGSGAPVVLIVPGSGPTDRDGDNPGGVGAATYRLLADALAERGVATVRIDKRGVGGSRAAIADPDAVTIADYAADVHAWARAIRARTGAPCVWVLGHSEGGLVALAAAQAPDDLCGLVLVAAPGRPFGALIREQLARDPANARFVPPAEAALRALEAGGSVDVAALPAPLLPLFAAPVQGFLRDLLRYRPAALAAATRLPILIVQGGRDLQVGMADARALAAARPDATLLLVPEANHVLKAVPADDLAANFAAYRDPSRPLVAAIPDAIAAFVRR